MNKARAPKKSYSRKDNKVTEMLSNIMTNLTLENFDAILNANCGEMIKCDMYAQIVQKDVFIPERLKDLHYICVHVESKTKFKK